MLKYNFPALLHTYISVTVPKHNGSACTYSVILLHRQLFIYDNMLNYHSYTEYWNKGLFPEVSVTTNLDLGFIASSPALDLYIQGKIDLFTLGHCHKEVMYHSPDFPL